MYGRRLGDRILSFGHSGILYGNSFVMYDRETGSLWVHVTGRAESGPLAGRELTFVPSTVTTWEKWRRAYPHTSVLPGRRNGGFMGRYVGTDDPGALGLSVVVRFAAKLYPFDVLEREPVVNDWFGGAPIVVAYSKADGVAAAWGRAPKPLASGNAPLRFVRAGSHEGALLIADEQTGTRWSPVNGVALDGPHAGQHLPALTHHPIVKDRFRAFYPDAPVYAAAVR